MIKIHTDIKRYSPFTIAYKNYIYIYGGLGEFDRPLSDLLRYDTLSQTWFQMTPSSFDITLTGGSAVGTNFMLSKWGLLRFGGYIASESYQSSRDNYLNEVYLQNPVTLKWSKVEITGEPQRRGISIHTFMHTFIHSYIHTFIHTYIHTYLHIYIYIYIYVNSSVYSLQFVYAILLKFVLMYVCMYVCMFVYMLVCIYR